MNDIFLDVESSISGRRWTGPNISVDRQAEMILQETNFSSAMANVLARLGVDAKSIKNLGYGKSCIKSKYRRKQS